MGFDNDNNLKGAITRYGNIIVSCIAEIKLILRDKDICIHYRLTNTEICK